MHFLNNPAQQKQAETMLGKIMDKLGLCGCDGNGMFCCRRQITINELAPRVHITVDIGHNWDVLLVNLNYIYARYLILPTPDFTNFAPSVMVNLIGTNHNQNGLIYPLHNFIGTVKEGAGRRFRHINLSHPNKAVIIQQLEKPELNYRRLSIRIKLSDWKTKIM